MNSHDEMRYRGGEIPDGAEIHPEDVKNPEINYDRTDMSPKAIVGFLIFLAIAGVITHLVLWGIYKNLAGPYKQPTQTANPMYTSNRQFTKKQGNPQLTFPEPRLQADDEADMNKFRLQEEQVLRTYDWVDQSTGVTRIPITQAMQALAGQGLPVRQEPAQPGQIESELAPTVGSDGAFTIQRANQPSATEQPVANPAEQK